MTIQDCVARYITIERQYSGHGKKTFILTVTVIVRSTVLVDLWCSFYAFKSICRSVQLITLTINLYHLRENVFTFLILLIFNST